MSLRRISRTDTMNVVRFVKKYLIVIAFCLLLSHVTALWFVSLHRRGFREIAADPPSITID